VSCFTVAAIRAPLPMSPGGIRSNTTGSPNKDMAQAVPLRATLERHRHHVIGGTNAALVERARIGVRAGAQHRMDRVGAPHGGIFALCALRAGVIEVQRKRDHFALFDQARSSNDVLWSRVVERADLVIGPPLAPILVFLSRLAHVLSGDLSRRH